MKRLAIFDGVRPPLHPSSPPPSLPFDSLAAGPAAMSSRSSSSPEVQTKRRRRSSSGSSSSSSGGSVKGSNGTKAIVAVKDAAEAARTEAKGEELRQQLAKLSNTRGGGAYVPPARLRALMAEAAAADPGSVDFQRMSWDALKKSITGLVNKVAAENIKHIVPELFGGANLIRGRGLFCRSIIKAQMQSLSFTPVFAALAAIVNSKLPMVGELLVHRLVSQFRRSFKRNDKVVCNATAMFLAHQVNQRVVHEVLALEMLVLLLEKPTDDSVEVAVGFMREVGAFLAEESPKANSSIYDRFRAVLYEGAISKRVQYMIEVLSQVRREKYKDNARIPELLDLVEEDDQITHEIGLDDEINVQESLNVFKFDPEFVENEERYREIKAEILGEGSDSGIEEESGSGDDSDEESDVETAQAKVEIQDKTEINLVNLRRTIYLTIQSSGTYEEAVHKLMKLNIPEGQDIELCNMIIECCSQERTFQKFFGLIGERLSKLNRTWSECFEVCFRNYYDTIHRYETNRLRNIARFFGTLVASDSISWACFQSVFMTEEDTTSSSRIFLKILLTEVREILGLKSLVERFAEPTMQDYYVNMMPRSDPKATRFAINFYTSIGIPQITDNMREHLKIVREQAVARLAEASASESDSDSTVSSSSLSDSSSSYSSRSPPRRRSRRSPSPPPRRGRPARDAFSPDRTVSPPPRRNGHYSDSPPPRKRQRSPSYSRSPVPRRRVRSPSDSRSPPPRRRARSPTDSRSPPPRTRARRSPSYSRSPVARRRARSPTDSRSPAPRPRARSPVRYQKRSPSRSPPRRRGRDSISPPQRRRSPTPRRSRSPESRRP